MNKISNKIVNKINNINVYTGSNQNIQLTNTDNFMINDFNTE